MKDAGDHYEYIATYVDHVLAFGRDPLELIEKLWCIYLLKEVKKLEYYIEGNITEPSPKSNREGLYSVPSH